MGELSTTLDEFSEISEEYYKKVMLLLRDKYCWKCPQRSTSGQISCREVDAWVRLITAFETGILDSIKKDGDSKDQIDIITSGFMHKIKRKTKKPRMTVLLMDEDHAPYLKKGTFILIDGSSAPRKDDLVLISQICPLYNYLHLRLDLTDFPFKIEKVDRIFMEDGFRQVSTVEGSKIPVEHLAGVISKIINKNDSLYEDLGLNVIKRR
jgi:hypothetical protein